MFRQLIAAPFLHIFLVCLLAPSLSLGATKRPNFIIFLLDDLGRDQLGAYGNSYAKTPNINGLAREGVTFTNAFLASSAGEFSQASLLTSRYPHNTAAPSLRDEESEQEYQTLAGELGKAGYYTAHAGPWQLSSSIKRHFSLVAPSGNDAGNKFWLDTLYQRPKDKPFFFVFSIFDNFVKLALARVFSFY